MRQLSPATINITKLKFWAEKKFSRSIWAKLNTIIDKASKETV